MAKTNTLQTEKEESKKTAKRKKIPHKKTSHDITLAKALVQGQYYDTTAKQMQGVLYWTALLIIGIASLLVSVALIPFVIFAPVLLTYFLTMVIGLFFGFVIAYLITSLYHLKDHHHAVLALYTPAIALASIANIILLTTYIAQAYGTELLADPIIVSGLLLLSYALPYLFYSVKQNILKKTRKS